MDTGTASLMLGSLMRAIVVIRDSGVLLPQNGSPVDAERMQNLAVSAFLGCDSLDIDTISEKIEMYQQGRVKPSKREEQLLHLCCVMANLLVIIHRKDTDASRARDAFLLNIIHEQRKLINIFEDQWVDELFGELKE